jgi:DNA-binding SARP family transcriptional activator
VPVDFDFCLLGPMMVRRGTATVTVPRGKQRAILAMLLLNAGRVVRLDELTEMLWDSGPPPSGPVAVQNHVMRLRNALGDAGRERIITQPPGYLMRVEAGELDVAQFEALLQAARAAARGRLWDPAAADASEALRLWRGEPLADVDSDVLAAREAPRLAELRLQTLEIRIDADLHLGRQADVIAELQQLVTAYPLRERLHGLLMLALYRDGRQAEALAAYQQARLALVAELGTEPGPELRGLQQQVLTSDPALNLPAPIAVGGATSAVPRDLPPAVSNFIGRTDELRALTAMLDDAGEGKPGTVVISAIGGTAGVGKTALAVHWAHQVAGRFPDGQLHVNLRGFGPPGAPATATEAIRGFLDALGVPPERVPATPEAQARLYRNLLSGKRVLIIADNAQDEQQVRPLLPASPGSLVLVTSRSQLGGLAAADGARLISVDVLSHDEAVLMLTARLGRARAAAESAAVDEIARLCAGLPLALAVAAARAAARPNFPLTALAAEFRDSAGLLDALDAGDPAASVGAVLSWSYRQLSDESARMFRLLGIQPGPDISVPAAASLAAMTEPDARQLLQGLARVHLIAEHVPGRYAFHDLLRAYAATQADQADSEVDRDAATCRVLDHYLHTAAAAARLLNPAREPVVLAPPRPGAAIGQPVDRPQALAWFEAEHQALLAAVTLATAFGFDVHAWQLPWAMGTFLRARGHWQENVATQRLALAAATRLGDAAAQALSGRLLANTCTDLGDHDQARRHFASSLTLYQRLGDRLGQAKIHHGLGFAAERQGRYADALGHNERALLLYQAIGDKADEAQALNDVGWCHGLLGEYQQARAFARQALVLCAEADDRGLEGYAWDSVGYAEHHLGNLSEAATCYERALSLKREFGDRFDEASTLTRLGDTRHDAGELPQARQAWRQALTILEDLQHPDADQVRDKLASTNDHASPDPSA